MRDYAYIMSGPKLFQSSGPGVISGDIAPYLNVGEGRLNAIAVVDVTQVEIASNDEYYRMKVQGSSSATFASGITDLAELTLGAKEVIGGDVDSTYGRYKIPFCNEKDGVVYPYLRFYVDAGGTIANGMRVKGAWLEKDPAPTNISGVTSTSETATTTTTA